MYVIWARGPFCPEPNENALPPAPAPGVVLGVVPRFLFAAAAPKEKPLDWGVPAPKAKEEDVPNAGVDALGLAGSGDVVEAVPLPADVPKPKEEVDTLGAVDVSDPSFVSDLDPKVNVAAGAVPDVPVAGVVLSLVVSVAPSEKAVAGLLAAPLPVVVPKAKVEAGVDVVPASLFAAAAPNENPLVGAVLVPAEGPADVLKENAVAGAEVVLVVVFVSSALVSLVAEVPPKEKPNAGVAVVPGVFEDSFVGAVAPKERPKVVGVAFAPVLVVSTFLSSALAPAAGVVVAVVDDGVPKVKDIAGADLSSVVFGSGADVVSSFFGAAVVPKENAGGAVVGVVGVVEVVVDESLSTGVVLMEKEGGAVVLGAAVGAGLSLLSVVTILKDTFGTGGTDGAEEAAEAVSFCDGAGAPNEKEGAAAGFDSVVLVLVDVVVPKPVLVCGRALPAWSLVVSVAVAAPDTKDGNSTGSRIVFFGFFLRMGRSTLRILYRGRKRMASRRSVLVCVDAWTVTTGFLYGTMVPSSLDLPLLFAEARTLLFFLISVATALPPVVLLRLDPLAPRAMVDEWVGVETESTSESEESSESRKISLPRLEGNALVERLAWEAPRR